MSDSDFDVSDAEEDDALFNLATEHVKKIVSNVDRNKLLELYAFYKQATEGRCSSARPGWYELQAKQKWDAWSALQNLDSSEAKKNYIAIVNEVDPNWLKSPKKGKGDFWVSVSSMSNKDETVDDSQKTIFDFCREGNVARMAELISTNSKALSALDKEGLGLIHWSADRGHLNALKTLIDTKCNIDLADSTGQTALHYAVSCEHIECVQYLLDNGANVNIKDEDGNTPVDLCTNEYIKKLFNE